MPLEAPLQTGASRAAHSTVARVIHMRTLLAFLALTAPAFAQSGESPYIFGLHDNGGENNMADMGKKGWILFTERLGHDPADLSGTDYRPWSGQGFGILVRLNNDYGSGGTIPYQKHYDAFAQRVANYVAASP